MKIGLESLVLASSERDVAEDIKLHSLVDTFVLKPRENLHYNIFV